MNYSHSSAAGTGTAPARSHAARWLVVIDHHEARIYKSLANDTVPQQIRSRMTRDFHYAPRNGNALFEPLAGLLNGAESILVLGDGRMDGEMEGFIAWVKHHRPELGRRIAGSAVMHDLDRADGQLLATARDFFDRYG